ncbi:MAG: hypothetical protein U9Q29_01990 [Campylobacterota bacterium]|nr:hypothetical protein [Campylobacterota bacterium]
MFVSSYNTYIHTNRLTNATNERVEKSKHVGSSFNSVLSQNEVLKSKSSENLPINYVSNYKAFNNKQKLQNPFQDKNTTTYKTITTKENAKIAYEDSSKIFSLSQKPSITLNQTPKIESELNVRHAMINTYIANERYYQVTAA